MLPVPWEPAGQAAALQLIGRIYKLVATGQQTVKGALQTVVASSDTLAADNTWRAAAAGLRAELMNGRNEITAATWKCNYQPYVEEALRILEGPKSPHDGHGLLQRTLERWQGRAASRAACCIAIRNLTDHAMARHHAPACWTITPPMVKKLRGKAPEKRTKATLSDEQLLYLIDGVERRNPGWANVLRILALFGLRPIELQHLVPKHDDQGVLRLWCAYQKNCGGQLTARRWLLPAPLYAAMGERQDWNITGALAAGLLELPEGRHGGVRLLNGHYVEQHLRAQPEWKELKALCEARGEWLRPYTFRDSYSLRCHQRGVEVGAIAAAMGHSLAVHASSYRWASEATTAAAFEKAFTEAA
ncbi:site-specific integrase [Vulcanococcus limneticus]|uniref:site-specific integrase n=1 Tax=Vulcanococcus limneticus TaxID=2170428 RepID=UPI00398BCCD0